MLHCYFKYYIFVGILLAPFNLIHLLILSLHQRHLYLSVVAKCLCCVLSFLCCLCLFARAMWNKNRIKLGRIYLFNDQLFSKDPNSARNCSLALFLNAVELMLMMNLQSCYVCSLLTSTMGKLLTYVRNRILDNLYTHRDHVSKVPSGKIWKPPFILFKSRNNFILC